MGILIRYISTITLLSVLGTGCAAIKTLTNPVDNTGGATGTDAVDANAAPVRADFKISSSPSQNQEAILVKYWKEGSYPNQNVDRSDASAPKLVSNGTQQLSVNAGDGYFLYLDLAVVTPDSFTTGKHKYKIRGTVQPKVKFVRLNPEVKGMTPYHSTSFASEKDTWIKIVVTEKAIYTYNISKQDEDLGAVKLRQVIGTTSHTVDEIERGIEWHLRGATLAKAAFDKNSDAAASASVAKRIDLAKLSHKDIKKIDFETCWKDSDKWSSSPLRKDLSPCAAVTMQDGTVHKSIENKGSLITDGRLEFVKKSYDKNTHSLNATIRAKHDHKLAGSSTVQLRFPSVLTRVFSGLACVPHDQRHSGGRLGDSGDNAKEVMVYVKQKALANKVDYFEIKFVHSGKTEVVRLGNLNPKVEVLSKGGAGCQGTRGDIVRDNIRKFSGNGGAGGNGGNGGNITFIKDPSVRAPLELVGNSAGGFAGEGAAPGNCFNCKGRGKAGNNGVSGTGGKVKKTTGNYPTK